MSVLPQQRWDDPQALLLRVRSPEVGLPIGLRWTRFLHLPDEYLGYVSSGMPKEESAMLSELRVKTSEEFVKTALQDVHLDLSTFASHQHSTTSNHLNQCASLWALEELSSIHDQQFTLQKYPRIKARADPALKKIHPLGKSPVLVVPNVDGRDGEVTLAESRVILQFLSDAYGKGIWTPTTLEDKMRDDYFTEFASASLGVTYTLLLVFGMIPKQSPFLVRPLMSAISGGAIAMIKKEVEGPHQLMEDALSDAKPWFAGAKIGLADFSMSWQMDLAGQRGYLDQKKFPKIAAWVERVHTRPAYKKALERGSPYDLVSFGM